MSCVKLIMLLMSLNVNLKLCRMLHLAYLYLLKMLKLEKMFEGKK